MANRIRLGLLAGAALGFALAMASPAAAQYRGAPYPTYSQSVGFDARIGQLRVRLDAEVRRGTLSRGEVAALRARLDQITRLQRAYYRNGLNAAERADLERRLRDFRMALRDASDRGYGRNGDRDDNYRDRDDYRDDDDHRRGDAYDRRDADDDDDRDDDRIDRNRDGWDDRDRDRDGRWEDDDRDIDDDDYPGVMLRVGQRATTNLGGVPYQYRDRYRDGGGVYYRSDGRAIYQIDSRTNAVVRVYPIDR